MIPKFTTLVAVDVDHANELDVSWRTWEIYRPEVTSSPAVFICDSEQGDEDFWRKRLKYQIGRNQNQTKIVLWSWPDPPSQREKMLTALVRTPSIEGIIETDWYLKLDTDTIATAPGETFTDAMFKGKPMFISSPWGYTKPASMLLALDEWAATVDELKNCDPIHYEYTTPEGIADCPRIISYIFMCRVDWSRKVDRLSTNYRLPCPSQDTFMWYCAARMNCKYVIYRFGKNGWSHGNGPLREAKKIIFGAK